MQRISKSKNGVTLIILVITIIVLFIILGITIQYGLSEIHDVSNKKTESELGIVQEAVMQRYALVKAEDQLGIVVGTAISSNVALDDDSNRPSGFVGTRLANPKTTLGRDFSEISLARDYTESTNSSLAYEEFYYLLDESDLQDLGIEKGDDSKISDDVVAKNRSYVVNYFTGEIFDIANKKYYKTDTTKDDPIYKKPANVTTNDGNYVFNDNP